MNFGEYSEAVQNLTQGVIESRGKDAELTLRYCNDIISYATKTMDKKLLGFAYFYSGETYYCLNDGANFFDCVSKAVTFLNEAQEWELLANCYNCMGIISGNRGNAPISYDYYLNALQYCKQYNLPKEACKTHVNISSLNLMCNRYEEAQEYLEKAYSYMKDKVDDEAYDTYMMCIYGNLAKTYTFQGKLQEARKVLEKIHSDHWNRTSELDHLAVWCVEAIYFHYVGDRRNRDIRIDEVQQNTTANMTVMDIFDDYYDFCQMLLETEKKDVFWKMMEILEPLIRNANMGYLLMKIISLQVKYYHNNGQQEEYLEAAGVYYELSELQEKESRKMISSMLNVRRNLEAAREKTKEMEIQNQRLLEKSEQDPLTKMANRYRLNDYVEEAFQRACKQKESLTFEILDIDFFKEFNDNYGHQQGDECLVKVAGAICEIADKYHAFCARYGGDEFVLIYESISQQEALLYAAELKQKIMNLSIEHRYSKMIPVVTISQGLCWDIPDEGKRVWDFLHAADSMLYKVKGVGRNNFCIGNLVDSERMRTDTRK